MNTILMCLAIWFAASLPIGLLLGAVIGRADVDADLRWMDAGE